MWNEWKWEKLSYKSVFCSYMLTWRSRFCGAILQISSKMIVFLTSENALRYYPYDKTINALEEVYEIMHERQCGKDVSRHFVTLVWDEYMANILSLLGTEKKKAEGVMRKVSEILMIGRSLAVRIIVTCQRGDSLAFPTGSRLNFGVIIILGASLESIYSCSCRRN